MLLPLKVLDANTNTEGRAKSKRTGKEAEFRAHIQATLEGKTL